MTSTLCQSAALGRIIAPWLVMIAELFGIIVETILSMMENVSNTLHRISNSLLSRCEAMGEGSCFSKDSSLISLHAASKSLVQPLPQPSLQACKTSKASKSLEESQLPLYRHVNYLQHSPLAA